MRARLVLTLILSLMPAAASAQPAAVVVVDDGAPELAWRRWQRRLESELEAPTTLEAWARDRAPIGRVSPERLEVLSLIETLLIRARHATASLQERDALGILTRAERLAEQHLDVPGMSDWYAEVQLAIAITAAQAGMDGLSGAALRRAASVDPQRDVQVAEARPEVVERARQIRRAAVTGPRGRFEVRSDVDGAVVMLDDRTIGALPRTLTAPVGLHVLRVEAPGHRPWARVVQVLEGERPALSVQLSPTRELAAARRVEAAARAGEPEAVVAALAALASLTDSAGSPEVWLLWAGRGPLDRAVALRCDAERCDPARRYTGDAPVALSAPPSAAPQERSLEWLAEIPFEPPPPPEPEWYERWWLWVGAGAIAIGALTAILVAAQPQGPGPVDPVLVLPPQYLPGGR